MNTIPFDTGVTARGAAPRNLAVKTGALLHRIFAALREWRRRAVGRAELARFDDRMLRDIGVTRAEALYEIDKPFWRR